MWSLPGSCTRELRVQGGAALSGVTSGPVPLACTSSPHGWFILRMRRALDSFLATPGMGRCPAHPPTSPPPPAPCRLLRSKLTDSQAQGIVGEAVEAERAFVCGQLPLEATGLEAGAMEEVGPA